MGGISHWRLFNLTVAGLLQVLGLMPVAAYADNWHGSIASKMQVDNRYTNNASYFGESIGRFEYENKRQQVQAGVDVLLRYGNYDFNNRQDFYRLFIQKGFKDYNTTLKAGRFEQADSLGFYTLNGASALYVNEQQDLSVEVYGGMPQRFDDIDEVTGDALGGIKATFKQTPRWHSTTLGASVDNMEWRAGYLFFSGQDVSRYIPLSQRPLASEDGHKLSLGWHVDGKFDWRWLQSYEARLIGIYRADTNTLEDGQFELQANVDKATRLRTTYEYYRPDRFANPTFREQFYSQYGFGRQELLRVSAHHRWQEKIDVYAGFLHSARSNGDDGYGVNAGASGRLVHDLKTGLDLDYLELGNESVAAAYLGNEYFINSRQSVLLNAALRREDKLLYGVNWVKGVETRWNYLVQSNLIVSLGVNYIWNSRLQNEYLGAMQVTYYFDNFKAKERQR